MNVSQKSSADKKGFGGILSRPSFRSRRSFLQLLGVLAADGSQLLHLLDLRELMGADWYKNSYPLQDRHIRLLVDVVVKPHPSHQFRKA